MLAIKNNNHVANDNLNGGGDDDPSQCSQAIPVPYMHASDLRDVHARNPRWLNMTKILPFCPRPQWRLPIMTVIVIVAIVIIVIIIIVTITATLSFSI